MDGDPGSSTHIIFTFSDFFGVYWPQFLTVAFLLGNTAFISACEMAFFSLTRDEVEEYRKADNKKSRTITDLLQKPRFLLATQLIFLNLVNVGLIIVSSVTIADMVSRYGWHETEFQKLMVAVLEVGIITFILLLFGEITPKVYAVQNRMNIVNATAYILKFLRTVLHPLSWVMINSTKFIDKRITRESEFASKENIKMAIDLTSDEDSPEEEKQILKGLIDFSSISVKAIMTSRVDMRAINLELSFEELVSQINEFGYSRIPVFEESPDSIKGILYVKDLLPLLDNRENQNDWQKLLRPPLFVPETKKIDTLLEEFRERRLHIAIVVDEFGGTAGIVTLEDIIEEIFGEINDEFDNEDLIYSKLSDKEFVFDGKTALHQLFEVTKLDPSLFKEARGDKDSLAGLILEFHGKIPVRGEVIEYNGFMFHIESVVNNRIRRVKLVIPEIIEEATSA